MRITAVIDDELVEKARKLTNINSNSELVRTAVKALVEREAARRLAKLGGSQPHLPPFIRRPFGLDSD